MTTPEINLALEEFFKQLSLNKQLHGGFF